MRWRWAALPVIAAVSLSACATVPSGPSLMVLPGHGKTFDQFQTDDAVCRQWSAHQVGIEPGGAAANSTVMGSAVGTLIGAGLGAAIGAATGHAGFGAAIGAGGGLLGGTAVGASAGEASRIEVQRRYDAAYQQCMYAKGNQIPVRPGSTRSSYAPPPPPPPAAVPPPPPGPPPPPPPPR